MGIEHVYDSRSTEFADEIRRDTGGCGVDVVLNSLICPAQRAGIELLAFGGRFVEIGKRDVYEHTRVDLYPFRHNLAFYYADLALMTVADPDRRGALLRKVYQMVGDGALPVQRCPAHRQAGADRAARRPGACSDASGPGAGFRPDGSYIVTGGMGGLGLSWPPRWRRRTAAGSFRPRGPGRMSRRRGPLRG